MGLPGSDWGGRWSVQAAAPVGAREQGHAEGGEGNLDDEFDPVEAVVCHSRSIAPAMKLPMNAATMPTTMVSHTGRFSATRHEDESAEGADDGADNNGGDDARGGHSYLPGERS